MRRRRAMLVQASEGHASPGWTIPRGTVLPSDHEAVRNAPALFVAAPDDATESRVVRDAPAASPQGDIRIVDAVPSRQDTVVARQTFSLQFGGGPCDIGEGSLWRRTHPIVREFPDRFRELEPDEG